MSDASHSLQRVLARRRVPLGFIAAAATVVIATPTWRTWTAGLAVALVGECVRVWAAGHLEKGREVTCSGPYRFAGHPLYIGSTIIAGGVALAVRSAAAAFVIAVYMGVTIAAAIRTEEAELRRAFGSAYDNYQSSRIDAASQERRFSLARVRRNREERALTGLLIGFGLLALKIVAMS